MAYTKTHQPIMIHQMNKFLDWMESIEFGALISKSASRSREKLQKRGRNKHSNNICTYKTTVNVQKTISSRCILEIEEEEKKQRQQTASRGTHRAMLTSLLWYKRNICNDPMEWKSKIYSRSFKVVVTQTNRDKQTKCLKLNWRRKRK